MKKSLQTLIIGLLLIITLPMAKLSAQVSTWDGTWEPWTHGTGTEADPFLIENAQQLAYLAYRVNNGLDAGGGHVSNHDYHYKLMVDVDLNGSESFQWTPIGYWNSDADYQCFGGYFNGNSHTISRLYINSSANRVGFFGYTNGATIRNIKTIGNTIATTGQFAGGIIGVSFGTYMFDCISACVVSCSHNSNVNSISGGIVGQTNELTTLINCCNTNSIVSHTDPGQYSLSGGIVGQINGNTIIANCNNIGDVSSSGWGESGGIVGQVGVLASITNCYNMGAISSFWSGGIVGECNETNTTISNTYNAGDISSISYSGGIVGHGSAHVMNCYYLNTCGGNNTSGGQPMSSDAMKTQEFVETLNNGLCNYEYDFNNTNSGYPVLTMILVMATTQNAINATQSHATLQGILNIENTDVHAQGFEYKKTTDSIFQTVNVSGNGNISKTLSCLTPNTEYTYRVFCTTDDCGTYYGEEKTFTTLPVNVTTYTAANVTATSAVLHGSMDIGDATLTSKGFEYRISGEPNFTTINVSGNDNDFTAQLSGLQTNNTYEYRAYIIEDATTYYGDTKTFTVSWLNQDTIFVNNAETLRWVADQCNNGTTFQDKCIMLMNDITLPPNVPNNMVSIGSYPDHPFKGTFDGNGKLIYNLYIDQPNTPYQGFFGYTLNANLYNVGLVNITASGRNYTGGMVAYAKNTHMRDCYVNGGTLFALSYCGGLVGYQEQGTNSIISGCYNTCSVSGNNYVGGLVGFSNYGTVRNSYVAAPVSGQGTSIGAIIGGANEVLMYYCYFSMEITGQTNAIGENNNGNGKDGGEGMTNAQMRDPQFVNTLNQNLATPVWIADYASQINNGFPIIKWQRPGTSIDENNATKNYISLYPNPANDFVTIQSNDPNVTLKRVEVYDIIGRKMISEVLDGQNHGLSIDKLNVGVYQLRIQTSDGQYSSLKLVVQ